MSIEEIAPPAECIVIYGSETNDKPSAFPCQHGCDSICPSYPMYRVDRHVEPCPHAKH
jgi:hypothetical protein